VSVYEKYLGAFSFEILINTGLTNVVGSFNYSNGYRGAVLS